MRDYVADADRLLDGTYEEPMSLGEYVEMIFERPSIAAHASRYLLDAIESQGTRTVIEEGVERERYCFFDDPHNDGEHAVLGNTDVLNGLVETLRTVATRRGKGEKIIWFDGPTATGKSELKRCLINGLREYSKTPAGRRYTVEWNVASTSSGRSLGYGTDYRDEENWYESPVQTHPLSVFPPSVRRSLLEDLDATDDAVDPVHLDVDLDPFSREAYDHLEERYRGSERDGLFSAVTDPRHLRVKNYVVDVGRGIGVLHAEDDGSPKERLVGSWMPDMLRKLDSRGRKNPQAFSYDGILSQGNGVLAIVEDATQHADLLRKLLNVPDEGRVKLDRGIGMDVDTQLVVISNPDLDVELDKFADRNGHDPLKALKRRLERHEFRYLTNFSLEAELVRREITNQTVVWKRTGHDDLASRVREAVIVGVRDAAGEPTDRELAPHTVEAAALYSVLTRLHVDDLGSDLSLIEKALLFDRGWIQEGDQRRHRDDFDLAFGEADGTQGIPVTYTRDVIADLLQTERERTHPDLSVESVVMPTDVLDAMGERLSDAPVFSRTEAREYENRLAPVKEYVLDRQEIDVLDALLAEKRVPDEAVEEYVTHVFAWDDGGQIHTPRGPVAPDPLVMKVFETEHLGRFDEEAYDGAAPSSPVERFRREQVIAGINRYAWENRDDDFEVGNVDLSEIPVIRAVLETYDWSDVRRLFPEFDPRQWNDPPANTETARLKERTLERLEESGYSAASAELTTRSVMREVSHGWD